MFPALLVPLLLQDPQLSSPAAPDLATVPVVFEENRGQVPAEFDFQARVDGGIVLVSRSSLAFAPALALDASGRAPLARLNLVGAALGPAPRAESPAALRVSRFQGAEPCGWVQGAATSKQVRVQNVWPGIDALIHAEGRSPRYDFELAPGADPALVELEFEGFADAWLDDDGSLALIAEWGTWRHAAPRVYQEGPEGREPVDAAFELRGERRFGFRVGAYDRTRPLVIDPTLSFLCLIGDDGSEQATDVVSDGSGGWWVVGTVRSLQFPYAAGSSIGPGPTASGDVFVLHFDSGNFVSESILIGGSNSDHAVGVAVDLGTLYVAGNTQSNDFPVTPDAFQTVHMGQGDAFVLKLDQEISSLLYSTYYGGSEFEVLRDFAVDASAEPVLVGETGSANLPTGGSLGTTRSGSSDAFAARLASDGTRVLWSGYYGGGNRDRANAVALDPSSTAFLAGERDSLTSDSTAFVQEVEADGDLGAEFLYGGSDIDEVDDLIAYGPGSFTIAGTTFSTDFPLDGPLQAQLAGRSDAFLVVVDGTLGVLSSTYFGGSSLDSVVHLAEDPLSAGYLLLLDTSSDDLPTHEALSRWPSASNDAYLVSLFGPQIVFGTYLPGGDDEKGLGLAVDADDRIAVVGSVDNAADEPDQPVDAAVGSTTGINNENAFFALIDPDRTSGTGTILFERSNDGANYDVPYEFFVYRLGPNEGTATVDWVVYANTMLFQNLSGTITFEPGEHAGRGVVTIPSGANGPGPYPILMLLNVTGDALLGNQITRQLTMTKATSGGGGGGGSSGDGCSLLGGMLERTPPPWHRGLQNTWWLAAVLAGVLLHRRRMLARVAVAGSRVAC